MAVLLDNFIRAFRPGAVLRSLHVYSPIQLYLSPAVARIPRHVTIARDQYTVFTANIVTYVRTFLVVFIAGLVKFGYCWTAFSLVIFHDFLDHVDGIVAKVHKRMYGRVDDPLLGGFLDAFCDKIVNVTYLWSLLLLTDYSDMSLRQAVFYVGPCAAVIAYEIVLGLVRIQDYYKAKYASYIGGRTLNSMRSVTAVMEGKLKETLESTGIALLCLAQAGPVVTETVAGVVGLICLLLSLRFAHESLMHKLRTRRKAQSQEATVN